MTTHRLTLPPSPRPNWSNWPHPPYSPDLAPCDFLFFPNLKKVTSWTEICVEWGGRRATEAYFADLEKTYFSDGLKKSEHRWVKCIELRRLCWEINSHFFKILLVRPPSYSKKTFFQQYNFRKTNSIYLPLFKYLPHLFDPWHSYS